MKSFLARHMDVPPNSFGASQFVCASETALLLALLIKSLGWT